MGRTNDVKPVKLSPSRSARGVAPRRRQALGAASARSGGRRPRQGYGPTSPKLERRRAFLAGGGGSGAAPASARRRSKPHSQPLRLRTVAERATPQTGGAGACTRRGRERGFGTDDHRAARKEAGAAPEPPPPAAGLAAGKRYLLARASAAAEAGARAVGLEVRRSSAFAKATARPRRSLSGGGRSSPVAGARVRHRPPRDGARNRIHSRSDCVLSPNAPLRKRAELARALVAAVNAVSVLTIIAPLARRPVPHPSPRHRRQGCPPVTPHAPRLNPDSGSRIIRSFGLRKEVRRGTG